MAGDAGQGGTQDSSGSGSEKPMARDELWVLVVLLVIVVLLLEWLVYHRDAVTRLWRGLRGRGAAPAAPGASGTSGTKAR